MTSQLDRITVNAEICGGRACIRGLRIRVTDILDMLAAGASRQEILEDYPYLEDGDITAALEFAASSWRRNSAVSRRCAAPPSARTLAFRTRA